LKLYLEEEFCGLNSSIDYFRRKHVHANGTIFHQIKKSNEGHFQHHELTAISSHGSYSS
jgi:hypothetical protein